MKYVNRFQIMISTTVLISRYWEICIFVTLIQYENKLYYIAHYVQVYSSIINYTAYLYRYFFTNMSHRKGIFCKKVLST